MAYSELIKSFDKIRDYMRQFYVYGFRHRAEYKAKSTRSYDNERRRIESWLGEYMSFSQNASGKSVFLSVDSRTISQNPLYKAFKAKSFTDGDIVFHFYILDLLDENEGCTVKQIMDMAYEDYLSCFEKAEPLDESTVRKKLREYVALGIIECKKCGRENLYCRAKNFPQLIAWQDAVAFFAEADPLGVIGSYLMDKLEDTTDYYSFKHHYILFALDSQVLLQAVTAIKEHRGAEIQLLRGWHHFALPMKIYISTQTGRQYLFCYDYRLKKPFFLRLDNISRIKLGGVENNYAKYEKFYNNLKENLWGVSTGLEFVIDHIEMTVRADDHEQHIVKRLEREKRNGRVEKVGEDLYRFSADVYDSRELVPWLRTFIGRIEELKCSDKYVENLFYQDLAELRMLYGGEEDAV